MLIFLLIGIGFLGNCVFVEVKLFDYYDVMMFVIVELCKLLVINLCDSWVDIMVFYVDKVVVCKDGCYWVYFYVVSELN